MSKPTETSEPEQSSRCRRIPSPHVDHQLPSPARHTIRHSGHHAKLGYGSAPFCGYWRTHASGSTRAAPLAYGASRPSGLTSA